MMAHMGELLSVQAPMVQALAEIGWTHIPGSQLERQEVSPFIESEIIDALVRLNPVIAEEPARAEEILRQLRTLPLTVVDQGLMQTNQAFMQWLRGLHTHEFIGTHGSQTVKLIDFETLSNNSFIVSDEVRYVTGRKGVRFDLVLWVNGFPLAVGELKSPLEPRVSWERGALDLLEVYQPDHPGFFTPNVLTFASEGKEFRYAALGADLRYWEPWGPVQDSPRLEDVLKATTSLLKPSTLLKMLAHYTVFESRDNDDPGASLVKIIARYPQFDAVELLVPRAKDPSKNRALIYHTQGSGKTLAMVFAAMQLVTDPALKNPTIVLIADRVQLVRQMWDQFRTTSMPKLQVPEKASDLFKALREDRRGMIFTTVQKFKDAPLLNERENIIVMVDEAHRTQNGDLGNAMRQSLPNANLFAFSGTPLAKLNRNTFTTFGDPDDHKQTLHSYGPDDSIRDGMTVPLHVAPRKVEFQLDREALDAAYEELSEQEGLTEQEQEIIASRAGRNSTFFSNPERIRQVTEDMIEHFYSVIDPLGMKAQVVVVNRAACVAYTEQLDALLQARYEQQLAEAGDDDPVPVRDQVAVVMTVGEKSDPSEWEKYSLSEAQEEALLKRFRTHSDPLKFLVCTSKLGTGFNAPIEGVLYLDKPLKEHTLFQTITRANRTWTNPETGAPKHFGTIVDYVGLGEGFARAMSPADPSKAPKDLEMSGLIAKFAMQLETTMSRFAGIDIDKPSVDTLVQAQQRLPNEQAQEHFAANYQMVHKIWETIAPHPDLKPYKPQYRFLSQIYNSIQPPETSPSLLWHRLGTKTLDLVHEHMSEIRVTRAGTVIVADAETVQQLIKEGYEKEVKDVTGMTPDQVVDSIAEKIKRSMKDSDEDHPVYTSLAERLEKLRLQALDAVEKSIDWLREAFELARDVTAAENAERESGEHGLDLLPDPHIGALTQIFNEFAPADSPAIIERVVKDVDAIVKQVRYDGWAATAEGDRIVRREVRNTLRKHQMHTVPGLFDRAYEYIAEHY